MPTPTPQVIEKQSVDIDFSKGLNEKDRPESMDWTKGLKVAENVTFDEPGVILPRPSVDVYTNTDDAGYSDTSDIYGPVRRVMTAGDGLVAIGARHRLHQVNEANGSVTPKSLVPEYSVEASQMGAWAESVSSAGVDETPKVIGTGLTSRYRILLHTSKSYSNGTTAAPLSACLIVADRTSGNVLRKYYFDQDVVSIGTATYAMTVVGDQYIHVYARRDTGSGGAFTSARMYQFDTDSLSNFVPTETSLSEQADIVGCVALSSADSIVLLSNMKLYRLSTGPAVVDSATLTDFSEVHALDTDGVNIHVVGISSAASTYDPAVLTLTSWWRASYSGSPWTGIASAGSSGAKSLTEATNPPTTGSAINGHTPADFDGTNDTLANATAMSGLLAGGTSPWSLVLLVRVDTNQLAGNSGVGNIWTDSGGYVTVGTWNNPGLKLFCGVYDTGQRTVEDTIAIGTMALVQIKYDGTDLKLRVNSGSWQTTTCGGLGSATGTLVVGKNYTSGSFLNGLIVEEMTAQSALSDTVMDDIKGYINTRYGLSL